MVHTASLAPEEEYQEIDITVVSEDRYGQEIQKVSSTDPFASVDVTQGSKLVKKNYNTLKKRYEGIDGAASKFLDPEQVYGYSLYNVVEPPYDLEVLGSLYDSSGILRAVIDSRVNNTVGLGYEYEPTLKAKKQIQKATKSNK